MASSIPFHLHVEMQHPEGRNRQQSLEILARKACGVALTMCPANTPSLSLMLADDPFIAHLNAQFRGKAKPTNVLSFPDGENGYLGDIAVSLDTIAREADTQHKIFDDHFTHMVVHGVLHLLGYDHEKEDEAEAMEALEINVLSALNIANPYTFSQPSE